MPTTFEGRRAMEIGSTQIEAGAVTFALQYRKDLQPDQGLCIQVMGEVDGKSVEILRFDCFDQIPHYHYGPEKNSGQIRMDKTTAGNAVGWTLEQFRNSLPAMIRRSGYDDVADKIDSGLVAKKLDELETVAREMALTQRRMTVHKRGDEVIEVGNIKFGLEFRELPQVNDRGLAIHVLSDVAGQEIELLAFDCFENNPHYHYGPRNKDETIAWDTTLVTDPLRWVLDRFKEGKLPAMIQRAGYPGVVAGMDTNLIAAKLEEEVEPKALARQAANAK